MRTTLSIPKHHEIVEQEMTDFLQKKYPRITVEAAKTIFGAMMELLTHCQSCESLDEDAEFSEVRQKKGVSKSDFPVLSKSLCIFLYRPFKKSMGG